MNRQEAFDSIRRKLESAYHTRNDYPPYKLASWDDRAEYHRYVMKLLEEWVEE
jgi:hypothetical protein